MFSIKTKATLYARHLQQHATKADTWNSAYFGDAQARLTAVTAAAIAYTYDYPAKDGAVPNYYTSNPVFDYFGEHAPHTLRVEIRDGSLFATAGDVLVCIPDYPGRKPGHYRVSKNPQESLSLRPASSAPPTSPCDEYRAASESLKAARSVGTDVCNTFLLHARGRFKHGIRTPDGRVFDIAAIHCAHVGYAHCRPVSTDGPFGGMSIYDAYDRDGDMYTNVFRASEEAPYVAVGDVIVRAMSPEYERLAERAIDLGGLAENGEDTPAIRLSEAILAKPPTRREDKRDLLLAALQKESMAGIDEALAHVCYAQHRFKGLGVKKRDETRQVGDFFSHASSGYDSTPIYMRSLSASRGWLYMSDGNCIFRVRTEREDGLYEYLPKDKKIARNEDTWKTALDDGALEGLFAAVAPTSEWSAVRLHRDAAIYRTREAGLVTHVSGTGLYPYWMMRLVADGKQDADVQMQTGILAVQDPDEEGGTREAVAVCIRAEDREMVVTPHSDLEIDEALLAEDRTRLGARLQPLQDEHASDPSP